MTLAFDNGVVKLYHGSASSLDMLADASVDCVVTSPPYWGLRSYAGLGKDQLGLEVSPDCGRPFRELLPGFSVSVLSYIHQRFEDVGLHDAWLRDKGNTALFHSMSRSGAQDAGPMGGDGALVSDHHGESNPGTSNHPAQGQTDGMPGTPESSSRQPELESVRPSTTDELGPPGGNCGEGCSQPASHLGQLPSDAHGTAADPSAMQQSSLSSQEDMPGQELLASLDETERSSGELQGSVQDSLEGSAKLSGRRSSKTPPPFHGKAHGIDCNCVHSVWAYYILPQDCLQYYKQRLCGLCYVCRLVRIFREVWRVCKSTATIWLNLGDSYATGTTAGRPDFSPNGRVGANRPEAQNSVGRVGTPAGLKTKDLVGIPWRVAFALRADGWYLRSDIIWSKPNPMPESVTDRPTKSHEYLFLLTKAKRYYYDQEAVREAVTGNTHSRGPAPHTMPKTVAAGQGIKANESWEQATWWPVSARNKRSVWTIATQPYPQAHFATFPEALVEPCIMAGTSEKGNCVQCGKPWERVVEKSRTFESGSGRAGNLPIGKNGAGLQGGGETLDVRRGPTVSTVTTGWRPTCSCTFEHAATVPAVVLDPFAGSGTTCLVAQKLGRRAIGVDQSEEYLELAQERIAAVPLPMVGL